jgi:signal transduction histidine kinase/ActR/RegA family two-component response regulator
MSPSRRGLFHRRSLAPRIAVAVSAFLALALSVKVELTWRTEQARRDDETTAHARHVAQGIAAAWSRSGGDVVEIEEAIETAAELPGPLTGVALVDRRGRITWSNDASRIGLPLEAPPQVVHGDSDSDWITCARTHGAWAGHRSSDGDLVAVAPLGSHRDSAAVGPRAPRAQALLLTWDTSAAAAARAARHLEYQVSGWLFSLAVGLGLWLLLRTVLSRPLGALTAAAARRDALARDFAAMGERRDEIGILARAMGEAQSQLEIARAETLAREARLVGAIDAAADGIVLASRHDGRWIVDHVNGPFARLCGRPATLFEGRTIEEGLATLADRWLEPRAVRLWVARALDRPEFEGTRAVALRPATNDGASPDGAAAPVPGDDGLLALDVTTRPIRDGSGNPIGRLWVARDVTRERAHERRLRRQNQELAALDLVGRRVSRSLDGAAILASALAALREVFDAPYGWVGPVEDAACAATLGAGEVVSIPDTAAEREKCGAHATNARSLIALPLRDSTGLVAALVLGRAKPHAFGDDEITLLRRVVRPVDAALENARLFARTEAQLVENQTLTEVSRSVGKVDALEPLLEDILRVVHQRLNYRNAAILLPDDGGQALTVRASVGYHVNLAAIRLPVDGDSVTARTLRDGVAINVADVRVEPGYVAGSDDIRSELALPLRFGNHVLGVLDVESDRLAAFGPDDERLLASVANQAAMVLQNARLLVETRARATRFEAVNEIARAVGSTLDPRRLDRAIVSQLARVVACERYAVLHYDHEERRVVRTVVLDVASGLAHDGDDLTWSFDDGLDPRAMTPHRAEWFPDLAVESPGVEAREVAHGMASMVLVPIALDGVVAAAIVAASERPEGFDDGQIRLLEAVSYHVGVALKNAQLFARLQESYTQLDEAQDGLVRSEKLRALGEMASGVAHDFNNVLGAILGRAQLLKLSLADADAVAELEIIEQAAQDGAATVRRLQDFTRVRTDRSFRPVAMAQVVDDCLSLTRGRWRDEAGRAGIVYEVTHVPGDVPDVAGEASELREVLTNLILNALDAMPAGGALYLVTDVTPDGEVCLSVTDSGEGMSDEVRARIFDPFFTTKGVRGVGLGLSVVYGIVQRHGGRIEVTSAPGQGSTMHVILPPIDGTDRRTGTARDSVLPTGVSPVTANLLAGGPALRIFVADDEPAVRTLLADLLRVAGHEAESFASGRELVAGLEAAVQDPRARPVDLVLTDLGMPEMSGWDVARAVREHAGAPPVVLVTGWGIQLDDQLLAESGVADVIAKPFTLEDVLEVVRRAARRHAA